MLWLLSLLAHAQSTTTGAISGEIADEDDVPLVNATVTVSSPSLIGGERSVTTDAEGTYVLPDLPPGQYRLEAEAEGWASVQVEIAVNVSRVTRQDVMLHSEYGCVYILPLEPEPVVNLDTADHGITLNKDMLLRLPIR